MSGATHRIWEIPFVGGPCSGKTTSLARVAERIEEHSKRVLLAPEVATFLIKGGLSDLAEIAEQDPSLFERIEEQILLLQRDLRARYRETATALAEATDQDVVIIYDRGEMDGCAYLDRPRFDSILERNDLTYAEVRDSYDLVVHLVSTAVDAPAYYTTSNNSARSESPEQAAALDRRLLDAWTGAHLAIVDNRTNFEGKLRRVERLVLEAVGVLTPVEIERKFLLDGTPDLDAEPLASAQLFEITQTYLRSQDALTERRVRMRTHNGQRSFVYTEKRPVGEDPRVRSETEERISRREYERLLADADPGCATIRKHRRVFVSGHHVFELDSFDDHRLHVLEVELRDPDEPVTLPSWLRVKREVTEDPAYRTRMLAARQRPV